MKAHYLLLLLAALICFDLSAAKPSVPDDEEDPYYLLSGQADEAIAKGDYEEAAARLLDAISLRPNAPESILLMSNLGLVYSCLDRDSLAISTFDEALRRAPSMRTVLQNRAKVYLKMGKDKESYRDFEAVINADSLNVEARFFHGTIALYAGKQDVAEKDFAILQSVAPEASETNQALATLYSLTGRDLDAIPYFKRLIATEPAAEYYSGLAGCYLALSELSDAGATIAEGLEKFPDDPELYYYRAQLNRDRYRLDEAQKDAAKAIKLGASPDRVKALFVK